jgi:hypothetical protein
MKTPTSSPQSGSRRRRERDAFSGKEAAKMLGIPVTKLYRSSGASSRSRRTGQLW